MTVPLMILAVLSMVGGWIGWPESLGGSDRFAHFLDPVIAQACRGGRGRGGERSGHGTEYVLMLASVLVALLGIWLARRLYIAAPGSARRDWRSALAVSVPAALQQVLRGPDLRRDVRESHQRPGASRWARSTAA